ncbi:pyrroline-5-carboxylate reductase [Sphingobium sp. YR768]|nr:pyrroline-5-carboxylate reductase [Sphingobium sp. YR768]
MGGAFARAWKPSHKVVTLRRPSALELGIDLIDTPSDLRHVEDLVVVLAVKPQVFPQIVDTLDMVASRDPLILSVVSGISLATISQAAGGSARIARLMSNTPASIGKGITAVFAGEDVSVSDKLRIETLLAPLGDHLWVASEDDMHAVTAISGSGPAYYFRMTEALIEAARDLGLPKEMAVKLARATLVGAAALVDASSTDLAELRDQVTSPGGTTAAALAEMNKGGAIDALVKRAAERAAWRSRELAG